MLNFSCIRSSAVKEINGCRGAYFGVSFIQPFPFSRMTQGARQDVVFGQAQIAEIFDLFTIEIIDQSIAGMDSRYRASNNVFIYYGDVTILLDTPLNMRHCHM